MCCIRHQWLSIDLLKFDFIFIWKTSKLYHMRELPLQIQRKVAYRGRIQLLWIVYHIHFVGPFWSEKSIYQSIYTLQIFHSSTLLLTILSMTTMSWPIGALRKIFPNSSSSRTQFTWWYCWKLCLHLQDRVFKSEITSTYISWKPRFGCRTRSTFSWGNTILLHHKK